jgi:hypothetical protein
MFVPHVAVPAAASVVIAVVICRYGIDATRRLVVSIVAIAAKDDRSRADRALAVLRDGQEPGSHQKITR